MIEVFLTFPTPEGSRQIAVEDESLTIGRGAVDLRFDDHSLSRHHATVYREGERVWISDENSTNGTFVNGSQVSAAGTPLKNGDSIRLGNETTLTIQITKQEAKAAEANQKSLAAGDGNKINFVPFVVAGIAVLLIGLSVIIIGAGLINAGNDNRDVVINTPTLEETPNDEDENENENVNSEKPTLKTQNTSFNSNSTNETTEPVVDSRPPNKPPPPDKTYLQMSDDEKRSFVARESEQVARMIGNRSGESITPEAAQKIKEMVDGYARRLRSARNDSCSAGGWGASDLQSVLERGQKNAHFVVRSFNSEGVSPQTGLYLAMIESEFCPCLQSHTGPLGMFQITKAKGDENGLKTIVNASPNNPDERCEPEKAAAAAARIMKAAMGRFGTGPSSVPLAIAGYNSGEGGLSRNLNTALEEAGKRERNFWSLLLVADRLSAQFQKENRKYVPKFFAAAIVGENPTVFGVNIPPLSTAIK
jgi:pSer/pThr/pTyr-binding forkhead associated (FHA) protein